ncbi:DMT family transporter [Pseudonocardia xinjiangensis]|uniref:DMT family transporter n=1 Tax=Pseudonocardia xinjiangensis TaxID=75289 RepID=A0ABX1RRF1_9PSEU|nr:DMT family transporter [Pseudonocardia xinjiangensis]
MWPVTVLAAGLALLASALFAVSTVAQQRSAATVPDDSARGLGLIRVLVHRPAWWAGIVGDGGGYLLQAAALGFGSLLLVQPLLVTTLLFALPLGAAWAGRRLARSDWVWAVLLAVSLAVFVVAGNPTAGVDRAAWGDWLPTGAGLAGLFVVCVVAAARSRGATRAMLLAAATALCYGVAAALTKGVVGQLDEGLLAVLTSWETYALVVVSVAGTLLQQSAFQAGELGASLPTMIVGEPVVAVVIGTVVLQEQLRSDGAEWALIVVLVAVMVAATTALARSSARTTTAVVAGAGAAPA